MSALDTQVGGSHYKDLCMQPIELIVALRCSFIQGNIIKYVTRYKNKNGLEDLLKVKHYAQLAIDTKDHRRCNDKLLSVYINRYVLKNKLNYLQRVIITQACYNKYGCVIEFCDKLIKEEF